jgi:hypothetical protein
MAGAAVKPADMANTQIFTAMTENISLIKIRARKTKPLLSFKFSELAPNVKWMMSVGCIYCYNELIIL